MKKKKSYMYNQIRLVSKQQVTTQSFEETMIQDYFSKNILDWRYKTLKKLDKILPEALEPF